MKFSYIIGHKKNKKILKNFYTSGRVPHALLFTGPEGVGKRKTAVAFAAALNCHKPSSEGACGSCPSCIRIKSGAHPGIMFLASTKNEGLSIEVDFKGEIIEMPNIVPGKKKVQYTEKESWSEEPENSAETFTEPGDKKTGTRQTVKLNIDQVRELRRLSYLKSAAGCRRKVFIIDDVSRTSISAQNSLLKILEEPPSSTHLLLVTSREEMLLPTVVSRCQRVEFNPLSLEELTRFVCSRGIESGEELIHISAGSPGKVVELTELGEFNLPPYDMENIFDAASAWLSASKKNTRRQMCLRKLRALLEKKAVSFRKSPSPDGCREIEIVENSINSLEKNANLDLTVSHMFLELYKLNSGGDKYEPRNN